MGRPVTRRRARLAALLGPVVLIGSGCVDFVAVDEPRAPQASAVMAVRSVEDGDSIVVTMDGRLVGIPDPRVTLAGTPADTVAVRGDTLDLQGTVVLPSSATRADLAVPFAPNATLGPVVVRVGMVRRLGPATVEDGDLVLPWGGPQVVDSAGGWDLVLLREGALVLNLAGPGTPPRPLRVPLSLLQSGPAPTEALMRLSRHVRPNTFYPLELSLRGETSWALPGLDFHP